MPVYSLYQCLTMNSSLYSWASIQSHIHWAHQCNHLSFVISREYIVGLIHLCILVVGNSEWLHLHLCYEKWSAWGEYSKPHISLINYMPTYIGLCAFRSMNLFANLSFDDFSVNWIFITIKYPTHIETTIGNLISQFFTITKIPLTLINIRRGNIGIINPNMNITGFFMCYIWHCN